MKSNVSKMKKRSLLVEDNVHEGKRSKQEDLKLVQNSYGDGVSWFRGAMIGKGSFGRVFVASLKNMKSRYSLYPPIMAVKSACVSTSGSIQKEKEILDNIRGCSNVIKCFGEEITTGENGQMVYNLLLEYGSGGTLADLIMKSKGKGLPESVVRRYARSILRGLSHVHKQGYVHCDLKPQNVMLVADNEGKTGDFNHFSAKIGDFGLSKRTNQTKNNYGAYYWRGTPMYLSPETVINGVQEQPADIWAIGCIVFEMLTGKPLWFLNQESSIADENHLFSVSKGISAGARSFLKKCLCRKVMCRLTASMLLNHPFLQGLGAAAAADDDDDDINGVEESHAVPDMNAISSSLSSFSDDDYEDDDDGIWYEEDVDLIANQNHKTARLHEVHKFPVLAICNRV